MTSSTHARSYLQGLVARSARQLAALLLCLAVGPISGCGKLTDESRVLAALSRLLVNQGAAQGPDGSSQESPAWHSAANASDAAANAGSGPARAAPGSAIVIIEAEETSTLYEPSGTPDSKAVFSYVDTRGGTHMVRGLHMVPAQYQARARRLGGDNSPPINRYDALAVVRNYAPKDVDLASYFNPNRLDVTLFSATWCGACRKAKRLLDSENVLYTELDIDDNPGARDEVRRILGSVTIPLLDINGTYVSGYNRNTILRLVKGS